MLLNLISDFLEYMQIERGYSPLTIREYHFYLKRFNDWFGENYQGRKFEEIDLEVIRKYRIYLAQLHNRNGTLLKPITQGYHIIAIRALLRYLLVQRSLNVLSPDKIELPRQKTRSVNFLKTDQVERLLNSPKIDNEIGLRDRTILETLFSTGLRVSELVSLNRDQVDLERQEFGVRGKGGKVRVVFLSDTATEWIKRYLLKRQDNYKPLFIRYTGIPDMKKGGEKMRLTSRTIERIVLKYAKRCGLALKVSPHTLRHSFATDLLIGGADLRSVQEMLGHESIRTTQVYTHITNRHLKEVHKAFHSRR